MYENMSVDTHGGCNGVRSLSVVVKGSCELPKVGASSQTLVLCTINKKVLLNAESSFRPQELTLMYKINV